jgi:hypothetical protein
MSADPKRSLLRAYSAFTFVAWTTLLHSAARCLPNYGVRLKGTEPTSVNRAFSFSSVSPALISALSRTIVSVGTRGKRLADRAADQQNNVDFGLWVRWWYWY